jgi:hypothetical protein
MGTGVDGHENRTEEEIGKQCWLTFTLLHTEKHKHGSWIRSVFIGEARPVF